MVERVSSFDLLLSFVGFSLDTNTELQFRLSSNTNATAPRNLLTYKSLSRVIFPKANKSYEWSMILHTFFLRKWYSTPCHRGSHVTGFLKLWQEIPILSIFYFLYVICFVAFATMILYASNRYHIFGMIYIISVHIVKKATYQCILMI